MQTLLGLDIGSSSVIAGILRGTDVVAEAPRAFFRSHCDGARVEVGPDDLLRAIKKAISGLGDQAKKVDAIALAVMSPAWVAMDRDGKALTPIVTHQDRRSVEIAATIEKRVGKARHLNLTGCRPFPGGISSTTWAWYRHHEPERLRRADLAGHLNTFLHRQMTGARVIDPSNASFTGLYRTLKLDGWSEELCHEHSSFVRACMRGLRFGGAAGFAPGSCAGAQDHSHAPARSPGGATGRRHFRIAQSLWPFAADAREPVSGRRARQSHDGSRGETLQRIERTRRRSNSRRSRRTARCEVQRLRTRWNSHSH